MSLLDVSGISRSGRVRKKSAKLIEMEESEKPENSSIRQRNASQSSVHRSPSVNGTSEICGESMLKKSKKLKIKFSLDNGGVEEMPIDNEIPQSDLDYVERSELKPTVPSLKIKLFQNSVDNYVTSPKRDKNQSMSRRMSKDNENAANILFREITSGRVASDRLKRPSSIKMSSTKKSISSYNDDTLYDPNQLSDEDDDEEAALVISDSNESLQAALEHAKSVKNPNRRLTETKIETTKSGLMKVRKVDSKADKKQKLSKITAYTLFARENRSRIQQSYPSLDFANISRRLGEVWQALPAREKMQWKRKAQKQKGLNAVHQMQNQAKVQQVAKVTLSGKTFVRHSPANTINNRYRTQPIQHSYPEIKVNLDSKIQLYEDRQLNSLINDPTCKQSTTSAIDLASHLKILGDSLNAIGTKLNSNAELSEGAALDLLLDSALCAMCPLTLLTNLIPQLNDCTEQTQRSLFDNIAFLMPGI